MDNIIYVDISSRLSASMRRAFFFLFLFFVCVAFIVYSLFDFCCDCVSVYYGWIIMHNILTVRNCVRLQYVWHGYCCWRRRNDAVYIYTIYIYMYLYICNCVARITRSRIRTYLWLHWCVCVRRVCVCAYMITKEKFIYLQIHVQRIVCVCVRMHCI